MKSALVAAMLLLVAGIGAESWAAGSQSCSTGARCGVASCAPAGGWNPYGGGLFGWWPCCCYPRCAALDDYCRKPLPCVCWPAYSSFYTFGAPDACCVEPADCGAPSAK